MIKKIKYLIFCFLLLFLFLHASSQDTLPVLPKPSRHSINLELGGGSVFYSLGYEYIFYKKEQLQLSGSIGIEIIPSKFSVHTIANPISLNGIIGKRKIRFYSFVGALNVSTTEPNPRSKEDRKKVRQKDPEMRGVDFIPVYRFFPYLGAGLQANFKKYYLRLYANCFYYYSLQTGSYTYSNILAPWAGLTLGYCFNTK